MNGATNRTRSSPGVRLILTMYSKVYVHYGFCEVVHSCRQLFAKLKNSCLFPHSSKVDDEIISSHV